MFWYDVFCIRVHPDGIVTVHVPEEHVTGITVSQFEYELFIVYFIWYGALNGAVTVWFVPVYPVTLIAAKDVDVEYSPPWQYATLLLRLSGATSEKEELLLEPETMHAPESRIPDPLPE